MFEGDSYLVHVAGGEVALAVLSGVLVFAAVASVRLARRHVTLPAAVWSLGFVFWALFVWLSPQVYYLLYAVLSDELTIDWIIGWPPGPDRLISLLTFQAHETELDPALGVLGWVMCVAAYPKA